MDFLVPEPNDIVDTLDNAIIQVQVSIISNEITR